MIADAAPTLEQLTGLVYTKQVLQESMRLYPPAWILGRRALEDDEIGGFRVPRGTFVYLRPYVLHRHPEFWPNPEGFDPDRFHPHALAAHKSLGRPKLAYMPFGGGQRKCIGDHFAQMEALIILAVLTRRFNLELAPGFRPDLEASVTLRPRSDLDMRVGRR